MKQVELGHPLTLEQFNTIVRADVEIIFSEEYKSRVDRSRAQLERWAVMSRLIRLL